MHCKQSWLLYCHEQNSVQRENLLPEHFAQICLT